MPTFKYKIRDKYGKLAVGSLEGENEEQIVKHFTNIGYTIVSINEKRELPVLRILQRLKFGKLKTLGLFTRQFATLIRSGLTVVRSLATLESQADKKYMQEAIMDIIKEVESGTDLYKAMNRHPNIFNNLYTSMVSVGETSGDLDEVLSKLADLIDYQIESRAKIFAVMLYPILAICAMITGFIALTIFVLPQIVKIFAGLKGNLPLPTLVLIKVNHIMQNYWYIILILAIVAVTSFLKYIKTKSGRYYWDKFKLKVPLIGNIIFKLIMSRFARIVAILVKSGVPILKVLDLASDTTGNVIISAAITKMKESVKEGKGMAVPMKMAKVFSPIVVQMVAVGEETGRLDELLYEVSVHYDREASYAVTYLATIIEPIIIVMIAIGVLTMALGVFLPMWNAYTLIIKGGVGI